MVNLPPPWVLPPEPELGLKMLPSPPFPPVPPRLAIEMPGDVVPLVVTDQLPWTVTGPPTPPAPPLPPEPKRSLLPPLPPLPAWLSTKMPGD